MTEKKEKGDLAVAKAICDLVEKDFTIFTTFSEHLPFDFIAYKENKCFRIQAKYITNDLVRNKTSWNDRNGTHIKTYDQNDFDYYALYYPNINRMIYPSILFGGIKIASELPNSATPFYWWEDFQDFTDKAEKKSYKDFGYELTRVVSEETKIKARKIARPEKEELKSLIWSKPTVQIAKDFGVSDKAIEKWTRAYGLEKPPRGYWNKQLHK